MKLNRSFWKGRRVFLTGHTGFKGSWLCLWLNALGADVTGFALDPPTQPNMFEQANVAKSVRSLRGDVPLTDSGQVTCFPLPSSTYSAGSAWNSSQAGSFISKVIAVMPPPPHSACSV